LPELCLPWLLPNLDHPLLDSQDPLPLDNLELLVSLNLLLEPDLDNGSTTNGFLDKPSTDNLFLVCLLLDNSSLDNGKTVNLFLDKLSMDNSLLDNSSTDNLFLDSGSMDNGYLLLEHLLLPSLVCLEPLDLASLDHPLLDSQDPLPLFNLLLEPDLVNGSTTNGCLDNPSMDNLFLGLLLTDNLFLDNGSMDNLFLDNSSTDNLFLVKLSMDNSLLDKL